VNRSWPPELDRVIESLFEDERLTSGLTDLEAEVFYNQVLSLILEHFSLGEDEDSLLNRILHLEQLMDEGYSWQEALKEAFWSYGKEEEEI